MPETALLCGEACRLSDSCQGGSECGFCPLSGALCLDGCVALYGRNDTLLAAEGRVPADIVEMLLP